MLASGAAVHPGFEGVVTGGESAQAEVPIGIGRREMRRGQNENESPHVLVNVAAQRDESGHVKDLGGNRFFIGTISPEVETLGRRVGKNVMVSVLLLVREFDFCPHLHWQKDGDKGQLLLDDLFHWQDVRFRKRALEINDGDGRIRPENAAGADNFIPLGHLALVKSGPVALVLGRWRAGISFIGLSSKFVGEVLLGFGEFELVDQIVFASAALLELAD